MRVFRLRSLLLLGMALAAAPAAYAASSTRSPQSWVATWTTSPTAADADPQEPLLNLEQQTVRQRVRVSVGGAQVRVRLSNEFGATPLVIGAATIGLSEDVASVK